MPPGPPRVNLFDARLSISESLNRGLIKSTPQFTPVHYLGADLRSLGSSTGSTPNIVVLHSGRNDLPKTW